jgi:hypothetical protein
MAKTRREDQANDLLIAQRREKSRPNAAKLRADRLKIDLEELHGVAGAVLRRLKDDLRFAGGKLDRAELHGPDVFRVTGRFHRAIKRLIADF